MLVIRRRPGECVLIGDEVEVEILEATSSQVKLGIRAPRSVTVLRKEIRLTLEQNREAARKILPGAVERLCTSLKKASFKNSSVEPIKRV